jgi:hypothetical protein
LSWGRWRRFFSEPFCPVSALLAWKQTVSEPCTI